MAKGAADAQGVHIYGEDDIADGTESGLLNLATKSISLQLSAIRAAILSLIAAPAWANLAGFAANWSAYTGFGWTGVKVTKRAGYVTITGAVTKSGNWAAEERILTLGDPTYRPTVVVSGAPSQVQLRTNGDLVVLVAGSGALAFALHYPV